MIYDDSKMINKEVHKKLEEDRKILNDVDLNMRNKLNKIYHDLMAKEPYHFSLE